MELLQGAANSRELHTIRRYIKKNFSEVVPVTEEITHQAVRLVERHALTEGLRLADALIAATALVRGFQLVTANERHYRAIRGLKLKIYHP
jgi:predicted nucleic acid-binding protein